MAANPPEALQTPTLTQMVQLAIENRLTDLHTHSWGTVMAYDATKQEVDVQLIPRRPYVDDEGDRQTERPAPLLGVPVQFPWSGQSGVTFRITPGDTVMIVFLETAADTWFAGGQNDVDSGDDARRHALTDAVAIAGLSPRSKRISPAPPTNAAMIADPDKVLLGSTGASNGVVTAADIATFMTKLQAAIAAMQLASDPAVSALQALQTQLGGSSGHPTAGWTTGSSKVKADT
jgi:hypothetical protein